MKKKGLVYRATMFLGFLMIVGSAGGEIIYTKYFKEKRNEEIEEVNNFLHLTFVLEQLIRRKEEDI